ncbi:universal stress protein [Streptomyces sp. ACA25]|uniref:universal stress protein n=1 Tax=Streptomyces sp. ACA25 TaxID=3022596 RepID=UPI00230817C7|nr:universal stress protein [Streptomyces sp. ACA25]MDB1088265.1 universal stress protein [Streptomyces sp. ACA25]
MTQQITVGLDGSPESRAAADWAAREAGHRGLSVHLVHAWLLEPLTTPPTRDTAWSQKLLDEAAAELTERHPGVTVTTGPVSATATVGLLEQEDNSEMIVLGSRGRGALVGFLVGSIGLRVLARAKKPVVLVREEEARAAATAGSEIVVGVEDLDGPAAAPLDFAFSTAKTRGDTVRAVHALHHRDRSGRLEEEIARVRGGHDDDKSLADALSQAKEQLSAALAPWRERYPDVQVTEDVRPGNAAEVLLTGASEAALVTVGRRTERPALSPRIGSVAHAVLHHSAAPVAVIAYS